MSGLSPIGDTIAVTTLAYKLYQKGYLVARDAPQHVRDLVQEVETIKDILYIINDQVTRESGSAFDSKAVRQVLRQCFGTLSEFGALIEKYEILSFSDRGNLFKKAQWANEQNKIKDLRDKLGHHERRLQLVLSVDGRSQLDESALSKDSGSPLQSPVRNVLPSMVRTETARTIDTEQTLCERSRSSRPSIFSLASAQTDHDPSDRTRTFSRNGRILSKDLGKPISRCLSASQSLAECPNCSARDAPTQAVKSDAEEADIAVAPPKARTSEPFHIHSAREQSQISAALQKCFEKSHGSLKNEFSLESWLRIATWWLIKSRIISRALNQKGVQQRRTDISEFESRWESTVSEEQASLDLLKSSWIFEEIILKQLDNESFSLVYIQKLATDLMRNIDVELRDNQASVTGVSAADDDRLKRLNTGLLEDFQQPLEAKSHVPKAIDDPSTPFRWIDVDIDNAGFETEKVVFRTFVNAQLGIKEHRSKSFSAPYLLLLWTAAGENDIFLSLINHRGTLNLSRKLSVHDLKHYDSTDTSLAPFAVDFPSRIDAEIKFLNANDVDDFLALPRRFFAAMGEQLARPDEIALFQTHILSYEDKLSRSEEQWRTTASMQASKRSSCGLRMYETVTGDRWMVTRRLVVNSAPDSTTPFCISHWLPLDKIEIQVDGTVVTVDWSNCAQHKVETRNRRQVHCYGYDADRPNCQLRITFGSSQDARLFGHLLLYPTEMPPQVRQVVEIEPPSSFQSTRIYRLEDEHEPDIPYSAIVSATKSPRSFHKSEIFYVYKDIDFEFEDKNLNAVTFHQLPNAHYESTKPRSMYPLNEKDPVPTFRTAVMPNEGKDSTLTFSCDHDLIRFMKSLMGWGLKYYGPLLRITLVKTGGTFSREKKEDLNDVYVQLWEKASAEGTPRTQLAIRLGENVAEPWITASLLDCDHGSDCTIFSKADASIELSRLDIQRGCMVDENMKAMTPGAKDTDCSKRWKLLLKFQETEDIRAFSVQSGLS